MVSFSDAFSSSLSCNVGDFGTSNLVCLGVFSLLLLL